MTMPYLYVTADLVFRRMKCDRLDALTERHRLELKKPQGRGDRSWLTKIGTGEFAGLILELDRGWPNRFQLGLAWKVLRQNHPVYFHFPRETAIEVIDRHRLWSYFKLLVVGVLARRKLVQAMVAATTSDTSESLPHLLTTLRDRMAPVPSPRIGPADPEGKRVQGTGVYLRLDYWAKISAGGSYGHTCYVAWKLAQRSRDFCCLMANRFSMLDELGLRQIELPTPSADSSETALCQANAFYYPRLRTAMEVLSPAFLYERLVLGNIVGARLSRELGIPYVVEFNGSELSMARSFGGRPYQMEAEFLAAERLVFQQASVINVVSEAVRDQVLAHGVAPERILVNPNGADTDRYAPAAVDDRRARRAAAGYGDDDVVIGFIGTFGGWHGIEVLAEALPRVCDAVPEARFLLIGDGNLHHLVKDAVRTHGLAGRVALPGLIPQQESVAWLQLCDIFISPHHRHMDDIRFFGSPTKIFEYMALAGGIVASDLEQIGEVLSPALRPEDFADGKTPVVTDQRAILCRPGDLEEFVAAITTLCRRRELCAQLGANARQAVIDHYSWDRHVDRLLDFMATRELRPESVSESRPAATPVPAPTEANDLHQTNDWYKNEVQKQWNNDPCGSHYADSDVGRAEWFQQNQDYHYGIYAPWLPDLMEFSRHAGERVLEIGGGLGNDLSQFARNGALVTDLDLSSGHLRLAQENFALNGLSGEFCHGDAEDMPFADNHFDLVYSCGVIHHTPNTQRVIDEIYRVLKPGGRAIIMVYAENSWAYWKYIIWDIGICQGQLMSWSPAHLMSHNVEVSENGAAPLVKVYSAARLRRMFRQFEGIEIFKRQMMAEEVPFWLSAVPLPLLQKVIGWNLILKARKPLH